MSDPDKSASFHEVLRNREYSAIFLASSFSWFGDYAARIAVTAMVYQRTGSVVDSAAAFAISYLPWFGIGAVLSAFAERHSYRKIMIYCDLGRMMIMCSIAAVGHLPTSALVTLLFANALLNPPFDSARAAMLPRILTGDPYVMALSMQRTAGQVAIIVGYAVGAASTGVDARLALLLNAFTFGVSALLVATRVRERQPSLSADKRSNLLRETVEGYSVVFRSPVMRGIALIAFGGVCFGIVPEGLAAAWSAQLAHKPQPAYLGAIMVAAAVGFVAGSLLVTRLVKPQNRMKLVRPFAIMTPLVLVPALFDPGIVGVVTMTLLSGGFLAGTLPATNGLFVQVLPPAYRARAFGVLQSGLHLIQGAAVLFTGWLAGHFPLEWVVGLFSVAGVALMAVFAALWPAPATIADAIIANKDRWVEPPAPGRVDDFGEDTIDLGRTPLPVRRPSPRPRQRAARQGSAGV